MRASDLFPFAGARRPSAGFPRGCVRAVAALLLLAACVPSRALEPQRVAQAQDATVLLANSRMSNMSDLGPAFCVARPGLFVGTLDQAGALSPFRGKAVLWPGQGRQRLARAKVIRTDKADRLVLVQVEGAEAIAPLELGNDDAAYDTMEVASVGFAFQGHARVGLQNLPAVRVLASHVTSLVRQGGALRRIALERGTGYGQCGAAVLDPAGRVVGVFAEQVMGDDRGLCAVPVGAVKRFLAEPLVTFDPPPIPYERRREPIRLRVRVDSLLTPAPKYEVELTVQAEGDEPLVLTSPVTDGAAEFAVKPVRNTAGRPASLTAGFPKGAITGDVADSVEIRVAGKPIRLSALRQLARSAGGPGWAGELADGTPVSGEVGGLESVPLDMGELRAAWDLTRATAIRIAPADALVRQVPYTIAVKVDGKVVGRSGGAIPLSNPEER